MEKNLSKNIQVCVYIYSVNIHSYTHIYILFRFFPLYVITYYIYMCVYIYIVMYIYS